MEENNDNYVELDCERAMISIPSYAVSVKIRCKIFDEDEELTTVEDSWTLEDVADSFRRAGDGYFWEEEDGDPHVELGEDESVAIAYLPSDCVFASIECRCVDRESGLLVTVKKTLTLREIRRAFEIADRFYIDEDDTFTLTEKGKEMLKEMLGDTCD